MTIGERIKAIRKSAKMNLDNFGARIGVTGPLISLLENGRASVTDRTILAICREFEIREEWLRTGEGAMKEEKPRDIALAAELEKVIAAGDEDFRKRLIAWLVRMPPERWKALEEIALDLLRDVGNVSSPAPEGAEPRKTREQEAVEVAARTYESALNAGEKASESGTPPAGAGIA